MTVFVKTINRWTFALNIPICWKLSFHNAALLIFINKRNVMGLTIFLALMCPLKVKAIFSRNRIHKHIFQSSGLFDDIFLVIPYELVPSDRIVDIQLKPYFIPTRILKIKIPFIPNNSADIRKFQKLPSLLKKKVSKITTKIFV